MILPKNLTELLTVLRSVPGILGAVAVALTAISGTIVDLLADVAVEVGWDTTSTAETVARVVVIVLAWLATASNVVARVVRVIDDLRGLDPDVVTREVVTEIDPDSGVKVVRQAVTGPLGG